MVLLLCSSSSKPHPQILSTVFPVMCNSSIISNWSNVMFIFVVKFISCLVYLLNLVLLKIEAVAASESDSGIGAVTFGDPVRDLNRQRAKMSTTESLSVQIDALRIEKQQLEVENVRFREKRPEQGALIDKEAECARLCAERDSLTVEASQLKSENEGLVAETGAKDEKDALQEKCSFQESQVEELSTRCEDLLADMDRLKEAQELKFYRELEKERQKWEAREQRLLQQLERAQGSQAGPSSDGGYPGDLGSAGAALVTSSAGSDIASTTVSNHSCTITPSGRDRPATAILSVTMSEPVVSAARTTASWPCSLGLAGSAESSGLMNTGFLSGAEWNNS